MKSHVEPFVRVDHVTLQTREVNVAKSNSGIVEYIGHVVRPPRSMSELDHAVGVNGDIVDDPLQVLFGISERRWHLEEKACELRIEPADDQILESLN